MRTQERQITVEEKKKEKEQRKTCGKSDSGLGGLETER